MIFSFGPILTFGCEVDSGLEHQQAQNELTPVFTLPPNSETPVVYVPEIEVTVPESSVPSFPTRVKPKNRISVLYPEAIEGEGVPRLRTVVPGVGIPPAGTDPCAGHESGTGQLIACYGADEGNADQTFTVSDNPSCHELLEACLHRSYFDQAASYRCEFNGEQIFEREIETGICDGLVDEPEDHCVPPDVDPCLMAETGDLSVVDCNTGAVLDFRGHQACQQSFGACLAAAYVDADANIVCLMDGQEIYRSEREAGACGPRP